MGLKLLCIGLFVEHLHTIHKECPKVNSQLESLSLLPSRHLPSIATFHTVHQDNKRLSKAKTLNITRSRGVQRFSLARLVWFRSKLITAFFWRLSGNCHAFWPSEDLFGMQVKSGKCSRQTADNRDIKSMYIRLFLDFLNVSFWPTWLMDIFNAVSEIAKHESSGEHGPLS